MKLPFLKKRPTTPAEFWTWFQGRDGQTAVEETSGGGSRSSAAASRIGDMLHAVHPDLVWGMLPAREGKPAQFEVSAGGLRSMIPTVLSVVEAAPKMPNCRVMAFKQPISDFQLAYAGQHVDAANVLCQEMGRDAERIHLNVYVPLSADAPVQAVGDIGFIILDHTLGEYFVMTRIGALHFDLTLNAPPAVMPVCEFAAKVLLERA